jgi:hypothetical protein
MLTHSSKIQKQLIDAGYVVKKQQEHKQWALFDNTKPIMYSNNLGDLLRAAEKEFGL